MNHPEREMIHPEREMNHPEIEVTQPEAVIIQTQEPPSEVVMTQREDDREQRLFSFKTTQLIWLAFGLVEALIFMRIVLMLIGANPASIFAAFIYDVSYIFVFPFEGLVGTPTAGGVALELSSIIAMIVYALLAWGIERTVWILFYRPSR